MGATKREWVLWVLFAAMFGRSLLLPLYTNRMSLEFLPASQDGFSCCAPRHRRHDDLAGAPVL